MVGSTDVGCLNVWQCSRISLQACGWLIDRPTLEFSDNPEEHTSPSVPRRQDAFTGFVTRTTEVLVLPC
jgi:hypothetical protein